MSDLYLILHKVRGEPAFDIAQRIQIGDEEGWIIPTSGHRAYPYQTWEWHRVWVDREFVPALIDVPADWPDHYTVNKAPKAILTNVSSLLASIGLSAPIKKRKA